jgi:hypothetical protein
METGCYETRRSQKNIKKLKGLLKKVKTKLKFPEYLASEEPPLYLG